MFFNKNTSYNKNILYRERLFRRFIFMRQGAIVFSFTNIHWPLITFVIRVSGTAESQKLHFLRLLVFPKILLWSFGCLNELFHHVTVYTIFHCCFLDAFNQTVFGTGKNSHLSVFAHFTSLPWNVFRKTSVCRHDEPFTRKIYFLCGTVRTITNCLRFGGAWGWDRLNLIQNFFRFCC